METNELSQIERVIHEIIEKYRGNAMLYAQNQMTQAYNEISVLLKSQSLREINQKKVNGISIETLKELYKGPKTYTGSRRHLIEFLQAKSMVFENQRLDYPNFMKIWTDSEEKQLIRLWKEGMSAEELSKVFCRHPGSIVKRLKKLEVYDS